MVDTTVLVITLLPVLLSRGLALLTSTGAKAMCFGEVDETLVREDADAPTRDSWVVLALTASPRGDDSSASRESEPDVAAGGRCRALVRPEAGNGAADCAWLSVMLELLREACALPSMTGLRAPSAAGWPVGDTDTDTPVRSDVVTGEARAGEALATLTAGLSAAATYTGLVARAASFVPERRPARGVDATAGGLRADIAPAAAAAEIVESPPLLPLERVLVGAAAL